MSIQKLRLKRGWSQQQLADASGLSARTIQRLENGMPASTESLKSIAAVFEVDFAILNQESKLTDTDSQEIKLRLQEEKTALRYVRRLRGFYTHLFQLVPVALLLVLVNLWVSPNHLWSLWVIVFMVLGLLMHGAWVFGSNILLSPQWELKQVEKHLGRSL